MNIVNMIKFQLKLMCKTPIMFMMFFVYPVLLTAIIGYLTQSSFGGGVSSYEYYSIGISGTIYSSVAIAITMLIFSLLFGVNYNGNGILICVSFVILSFMSNSLGMLLCATINNIGAVNMVFNIVQTVLCILGGAFFSLEALGEIPAMISKISPVKWLMDGLLNSMYDNNNFILFVIIGINIIIAVMLIGLTSKTFKTEKYL